MTTLTDKETKVSGNRLFNPVNPLILIILVLTNCSEHERDNPLDPKSDYYSQPAELSSSADAGNSSSSVGESSSSVEGSSSSNASPCSEKTWESYQFCVNGEIYDFCNGTAYNPASTICCDNEQLSINTYKCCNNVKYTFATHYCHTDNKTYSCGNLPYDPATHFCHTDGQTYSCGNLPYDPATHFCLNGSETVGYCGDNRQEYDPSLYGCKENSNGIYLKDDKPIDGNGKEYEAVLIGGQVWMAENLDYDVPGSVYYDNNETEYGKYGRLYDWAMAMDIDAFCNTQTIDACGATIDSPHQGICPDGWHLPSDAEWDVLIAFVHSDNGEADYAFGTNSSVAGRYLKAASGWNNSGNGTDIYGFAALPGGVHNSAGIWDAGNRGHFWSSTEDNGTDSYRAIYRYMDKGNESTFWWNGDKRNFNNVRCVRD